MISPLLPSNSKFPGRPGNETKKTRSMWGTWSREEVKCVKLLGAVESLIRRKIDINYPLWVKYTVHSSYKARLCWADPVLIRHDISDMSFVGRRFWVTCEMFKNPDLIILSLNFLQQILNRTMNTTITLISMRVSK